MMPNLWTPEMDRQLERLYINGNLSASQTAPHLGVSRSAVIARGNRIKGVVFPSDIKRDAKTKEQRAERSAERAQFVAQTFYVLRDVKERNYVIRRALEHGLTLREVAEHFSLTRQWVFQIKRRAA